MPKITPAIEPGKQWHVVANLLIKFKNDPDGLVSDYVGEILELFGGEDGI